ncbi:MAG: DUF1349 domain-containing protein, partial [Pseudomonadota bacterium]
STGLNLRPGFQKSAYRSQGNAMVSKLDALQNAQWLNPPADEIWIDAGLQFRTGFKTDFWQKSWYGFQRDDGHFLGIDAPAEFSASLTYEAAYTQLYDQAGLMLRIDADNWIKAGIEFSDGVTNVSTVVTRHGASDWSVVAMPGLVGRQTVRFTRVGRAVLVHFRLSTGGWQLTRLAAFPDGSARIGPMACTPERSGLPVTVTAFDISPPVDNALHG